MNILFVHQNFPGQYLHIVRALASQSGHTIVALGINPPSSLIPPKVNYVRYSLNRGQSSSVHPLASETEVKVIRGEACAAAAHQLKLKGFLPDIICAHPGWGESLFLADIWPETPILAYQEFFYHTRGLDTDFELPPGKEQDWESCARVRMKNAYLYLSLQSAYWNVTPTSFQRSTFPSFVQQRMSTIHDGIDTNVASPNPNALPLKLPDGTLISNKDKVVTFVNRSLEPYRGCHTFIRSIPLIQHLVPDAEIIIVGSTTGVSYGAACSEGEWKDVFLGEIQGKYDPSRVHFTGTLPYEFFIPLLQISSCHVYLTYPFVLSWSLLEAMSCGCSIVASSTPPVQEIITHGKNGLLVDFGSPNDLAESVGDILLNKSHASTLGSSARNTICKKYSLDQCLPRHLQLINLVSTRSFGNDYF